MNRDDRWRACFGVDQADLEHNLDIAVSNFAAELLLKHLEVMWAGGKLRRSSRRMASRFLSRPLDIERAQLCLALPTLFMKLSG